MELDDVRTFTNFKLQLQECATQDAKFVTKADTLPAKSAG